VITSCEFDHADIYSSLEEIKDQFRAFAKLVPSDGSLIAYGGDDRVLEIIGDCGRPVQTYGTESATNWRWVKLDEGPEGIRALIMKDFKGGSGTAGLWLTVLAAVAQSQPLPTWARATEGLGCTRISGVKRR
jgi:UDP-N-acetylmuramate-alanine ligase